MLDCIKNALRNIFRKKLRSILTIAGIAIGVFSVVIISIIGEVGKGVINGELNSIGIDGIAISANTSRVDMYTAELEKIKEYDGVLSAMPLMAEYITATIHETDTSCLIWGVDTSAEEVVSMDVKYGRTIQKSDLNAKTNVCVVDESFALSTYKRTNIVGKTITASIDGIVEEFEIIGVVASGGNILQGIMGDYIPTFIYTPYTTIEELTSKDNFDQIIVKLDDNVDTDDFTASITANLEESNGVKGSVTIQNILQYKDDLNNILNVITGILSIIAAIALIVAGLSIMTMMLVSVNERTREIGIKKSIGAKRSVILFEFLTESLLVSVLGSIIGTTVGICIGYLGCLLFSISFYMNLAMLQFCFLFTIFVGVTFGIYPAIKASKLKPVDALRFE